MRTAFIADPERRGLQDPRNVQRYCHVSQGEEKNQDIIWFDPVGATRLEKSQKSAIRITNDNGIRIVVRDPEQWIIVLILV
jgi:hypothetical protein